MDEFQEKKGEEVEPLLNEDDNAESSIEEDERSPADSKPQGIASVNCYLQKWRIYLGFWILGVCNNLTYFVLLSSAYDILDSLTESKHYQEDAADLELYEESSCVLYLNETTNITTGYAPRECLPHGTSVVLLAAILPTLVVKLVTPYFIHLIPYWIRVILIFLFAIASLVLVVWGINHLFTVLSGVVCTSISSGFAEVTFLTLTTKYDKSTVAWWSSGTGFSGLSGAVLYTSLSAFMSTRDSLLLVLLVVPFIFLLSYVFVLTKPAKSYQAKETIVNKEEIRGDVREKQEESKGSMYTRVKGIFSLAFNKTFNPSHFKLLPKLFVYYIIWLFLVFVAEYTINQSLFESLYYPNTSIAGYCLSQSVQYKWYQVMYQIGVTISRSSLILFHVEYFHPLSLLQVLNFVLLFLEVIFQVVPSFWIILVVVLYEGLLGGGVYANAMYSLTIKSDSANREFLMGVVSVGDAVGVSTAGLLSTFIHQYICSLGY